MFPNRFFCAVFFAQRYWPEVGLTQSFQPHWAVNANSRLVGPSATEPA